MKPADDKKKLTSSTPKIVRRIVIEKSFEAEQKTYASPNRHHKQLHLLLRHAGSRNLLLPPKIK
jgi:hypothetical protein